MSSGNVPTVPDISMPFAIPASSAAASCTTISPAANDSSPGPPAACAVMALPVLRLRRDTLSYTFVVPPVSATEVGRDGAAGDLTVGLGFGGGGVGCAGAIDGGLDGGFGCAAGFDGGGGARMAEDFPGMARFGIGIARLGVGGRDAEF